MKPLPYILEGEDAQGEFVEIACHTLEEARRLGKKLLQDTKDGPAWRWWATWGNHPITEEWMVLEASADNSVDTGIQEAHISRT